MGEPGSGEPGAVATEDAPTTGQDIQQQGYTEQQLVSIIDRVVGGHMANQQRQFDSRLTNVEQLRPQIEAVMGTSRRTEAMVQRIFRGTTTEEDVAEFEAAAKEQETKEEAQRAAAERDAYKDILSKQDGGEGAVWDTTLTLAMEAGLEEGLDEATVMRLMPKSRTSAAGDQFGYKGLYRQWRKALRDEAVKNQSDAEPAVVTPGTTGGGHDAHASYLKGLSSNGLPKTKEERANVDRMTARFLNG